MSDAIAKTDNFILIEKERLKRETDESEQTNIKIGLMQYENFRNIIGSQLERLTKTINGLPKGKNENKLVNLPSENVTLRKQKSKALPIYSTAIQLLVIVIVILILAYFVISR